MFIRLLNQAFFVIQRPLTGVANFFFLLAVRKQRGTCTEAFEFQLEIRHVLVKRGHRLLRHGFGIEQCCLCNEVLL